MRAQDSDGSISLLLSYPRAAQALDLTEQALRDLVWKNKGPVVTKIGRRRMFALSDLQDFIASHRRPSTPPDSSREAFPRRRRKRPTINAQAFSARLRDEKKE